MNTNFRRFKILEVRTMAGVKGDDNDATSFLKVFDDVLHAFGFVRRKLALCRTLGL